jgi:hypothetical protein
VAVISNAHYQAPASSYPFSRRGRTSLLSELLEVSDMASKQTYMRHARECVRLAGHTGNVTVRNQLMELAQRWILASRQERSSPQVIRLHTQRSRGAPLSMNRGKRAAP